MKYEYENARGDRVVIEAPMTKAPPDMVRFTTTGWVAFVIQDRQPRTDDIMNPDKQVWRRVYESTRGHVRWQHHSGYVKGQGYCEGVRVR